MGYLMFLKIFCTWSSRIGIISIWPVDRTLPLRVRVDLVLMAVKEYSTFPIARQLKRPYQIQVTVIPRHHCRVSNHCILISIDCVITYPETECTRLPIIVRALGTIPKNWDGWRLSSRQHCFDRQEYWWESCKKKKRLRESKIIPDFFLCK